MINYLRITPVCLLLSMCCWLAATSICTGQLTLSAADLAFELQPGQQAATTLILTNSGAAPVVWRIRERRPSLSFQQRAPVDSPLRPTVDWGRAHDPDILLIRFTEGTTPAQCGAIHDELGVDPLCSYRHAPIDVVRCSGAADIKAVAAAYEALSDVVYVEPNYILRMNAVPDDARFDELWGLNNTGQDGGVVDADIDAVEAWDATTGDRNIVVGVIDTGIDYHHPDLVANMWTNNAELHGQPGVDDDGNGIVDDIHGARWTDGDGSPTGGDPMDDKNHGTHVAGTIGAVGNNGAGVAGINHSVSLMALKFLDSTGTGFIVDAIAAVEYAIDHGAHLTSNSWGGGGFSQALKDVIEAAGNTGILFVASAGNDSRDTDEEPHYPSSFDSPTIISVASSTRSDGRSGFSNWGRVSVDIAAPGSGILSTVRNGGYSSLSGTSMATPHVAGVAALLIAYMYGPIPHSDHLDPVLIEPLEIKQWILDGIDPIDAFRVDGSRPVASGGRLNAAQALAAAEIPWISSLPSSGSLAAGESVSIEVTIDATGFNDGVVEAAILSATDTASGQSAATTVTLTATAFVQIDHNPLPDTNDIVSGYDVCADISATDSLDINSLRLFYRLSGAQAFSQKLMQQVAGGQWCAEIPAQPGPAEIEYYIGATDHAGHVATAPVGAPGAVHRFSVGVPELSVVANASLAQGLRPGEIRTMPNGLTISNHGLVPLDWEIAESRSVGAPAALDQGGPDDGGYFWIDTNSPSGPAFDWIEIENSGTRLDLTDDSAVFPLDIPFAFDFYGDSFSQLAVDSNGVVFFEDDEMDVLNTPIPGLTPSGITRFIAPYWDDMNPEDQGDVFMEVVGDAPDRVVVLQWAGVSHFGNSNDTVTFQVQLYEATHDILMLYADPSSEAGGGATVGIQRDVDTGLQILFNEAKLESGLAILYSRELPWIDVSAPHAGTLAPGESVDLDVIFDATALQDGFEDAGVLTVTCTGLSCPAAIDVGIVVSVDDLTITPRIVGQHVAVEQDGLVTSGVVPVTLSNVGSAVLTWSASLDIPWIGFAAGSLQAGSLEAGASVQLTLEFNDQVTMLPAATHHALLTVVNTQDNVVQSREIILEVVSKDAGFVEDFETGSSGWDASGLWHDIDAGTSCVLPNSGNHAWHYGLDGACTYETGAVNKGSLLSRYFLTPAFSPTLSFLSWEETEGGGSVWDTRKVYVRTPLGERTELFQSTDTSASWRVVDGIDLADFAGSVVALEFEFDTVDGIDNAFTGWLVDDVIVTGVEIAIAHEPLADTSTHGPFDIVADVTATRPLASVDLHWAVNAGAVVVVPMTNSGDGAFNAQIPVLSQGDDVVYVIRAVDDTGIEARHPPSGDGHHFSVQGIPHLTATPERLRIRVPPDGEAQRTLVLQNDGTWPTSWTLSEQRVAEASAGESTSQSASNAHIADWSRPHDTETIVVGFHAGTASGARAAVHGAVGADRLHSFSIIDADVVKVPAGVSAAELAASYAQRPDVAYAEPNYTYRAVDFSNDPRFDELWGLHNVGQTIDGEDGVVDADIDAPEAWMQQRGGSHIVVGVIDTGIDYNHEDLAANVWVNDVEFNGASGVDDDNNGIVDDIHGARWTGGNGVPTNGDPFDGTGHGTHVSGTIGAVGGNGIGVAGVNHSVRIMALKFLDDDGSGDNVDAISAIEYAVANGAHITNNSWGGGGSSQALQAAIDAAGAAGQLFVAAAGNDSADNDATPFFLASFSSPTIISVAATNNRDDKASFSHFGLTSVDLGAPGEDILSTTPGDTYSFFNGTSMASPHVTGVAALILANLIPADDTTGVLAPDPLELKSWILDSVDPVAALRTDGPTPVLTGGRLNAAGALALAGLSWVDVAPRFGSLGTGGDVNLTVSVSGNGLAAGLNDAGTLVIESGAPDSPLQVPVEMVVATDDLVVVGVAPAVITGPADGPFDPATMVLTVANFGSAAFPWNVDSAQDWIDSQSGAIAGGDAVDIAIAPNANTAALAPGTHPAALTVTNTDTGFSVSVAVALEIEAPHGTIAVQDSIDPIDDRNIDFPATIIGQVAVASVSIGNSGDGPLTVSDIAVAADASGTIGGASHGPDFSAFAVASVPVLPVTIDSGGSISFQVTFAPNSTSDSAGSVSIASDDPAESTVAVSLAGVGVDVISVNHSPLESTIATGPFTVMATITSAAGIDTATLIWNNDGSATFHEMPMTSPDGTAFAAEIPAQSAGVDITYYFNITDANGVTVRSPSRAPDETIRFRVIDGGVGLVADAESDNGNWTPTGLWHVSDDMTLCGDPNATASAWYYGQDETCSYDTGATTSGILASPFFQMPALSPTLTFLSWEQTEGGTEEWDTRRVFVTTLHGDRHEIFRSRFNDAAWRTVGPLDLVAFSGAIVSLEFEFDSVDALDNAFGGWFVDDIAVIGAAIAITHNPLLDTFETGPFTVAADIIAVAPITDVTVAWSVDDGPVQTSPMSWSGGNTFTGAIPEQNSGAIISYLIRAEDDMGNVVVHPQSDAAMHHEFEIFAAPIDDDAYEENDHFAAAFHPGAAWRSIPLSALSGTGVLNDADWYRFDVQSSRLRVDVSPQPPGAVIELFDHAGALVAPMSSDHDNNTFTGHWATASGDYRLLIIGPVGSSYDLVWQDFEPPEIVACANDRTIAGDCTAELPDLTSEVVPTDPVDSLVDLSITQNPGFGDAAGFGDHKIDLTVTNTLGGEATCTATVIVIDTTAPEIVVCPPDRIVVIDVPASFPAPVLAAEVSATDNCDTASTILQQPVAGTPLGPGGHALTLTVADDFGNEAHCVVAVSVVVHAGSFTVSSFADAADANPGDGLCDDGAGGCTLRAAIMEANALPGEDTIVLSSGTYALMAPGAGEDEGVTGDLDILGDTVLIGEGPNATTIDGSGIDRVIHVDGVRCRLEGLTITGGAASLGGGLFNNSTAQVTIENCHITGNMATSDGGGINNFDMSCELMILTSVIADNMSGAGGGGISNDGFCMITDSVLAANEAIIGGGVLSGVFFPETLDIVRCEIRGNSATDEGGGIYNAAVLSIENSTVTGNTAGTDGGGIFMLLATESASVTHCTITDNTAVGDGGGILDDFNPIILGHTIVAGNAAFAVVDIGNDVDTLGFNLVGNSTDATGFGANDLLDIAPLLGPLQDNGGPTQTRALSSGSPAIDAGDPAFAGTPQVDQRGALRVQGIAIDIGAFESLCNNASPPEIVACAPDQTIALSDVCTGGIPDLTDGLVATDDCDMALTVSQSPVPGAAIPPGTAVVTVTVADSAGNNATCTASLQAIDVLPPEITTCPTGVTLVIDANCEVVIPDLVALAGASDNCDTELTVTQIPAADAIISQPPSDLIVEIEAGDNAGNTATCVAMVSFIGSGPDFDSCPDDIVAHIGAGEMATTVFWDPPVASDNCGAPDVSSNADPGDSFSLGSTVVMYSAVDDNGNTADCAFTILVVSPTSDADNDDLLDEFELQFGLDPLQSDSDGNGTADSDEDPDNDNLSNLDEQIFSSHPFNWDSDGDGMYDFYEAVSALNLAADDRNGDRDGDGLSNIDEYFGIDGESPFVDDITGGTIASPVPNRAVRNPADSTGPSFSHGDSLDALRGDTDFDGLVDLFEFVNFVSGELDPVRADGDGDGVDDPDEDPDADNLTNLDEQAIGTSPIQLDSDDDFLSDGDEVLAFQSDPLSPDTDDDGHDDGSEVAQAFDPLDSLSKADLRNLVLTSNGSGSTAFAAIAFAPKHSLVSWTVAAWVRTADADGGVILKRGVPSGDDPGIIVSNYELAVDAVGGLVARFHSNLGIEISITGPFIADDNWHHVGATYDQPANAFILYVDGVAAASTATALVPAQAAGDVRVFGGWGGDMALAGAVDDVRIYDHPFAAVAFEQFAPSCGIGSLTGTEPGLVVGLRFDDDQAAMNGRGAEDFTERNDFAFAAIPASPDVAFLEDLTVPLADIIAPVITQCPDDVTVTTTVGVPAVVPDLLGSLVASDACSSALVVTQQPPVGAGIAGSTAAVIVSAADAAGNVSTCNVTVTVDQADRPDLAGRTFVVSPDHVLLGQTTISYSIKNNGPGDAGAFISSLVMSVDAVIGNEDDTLLATVGITGIAAGSFEEGTFSPQLNTADLFSRALADDPPGPALGQVSANVFTIGMVVDIHDDVAESNETNNANTGLGVDQDDVTYFPWDMNPTDGALTPTDVIFVINRLGDAPSGNNALADVDGNGAITPTDAISVINRLGLLRNDAVIEVVPAESEDDSVDGR